MKRIKKTIAGVILAICFILLLGITGGVETGSITLAKALPCDIIIIAVMFSAIVVGRLYVEPEASDE